MWMCRHVQVLLQKMLSPCMDTASFTLLQIEKDTRPSAEGCPNVVVTK